ncbi:hypothetical protein F511_16721 [Dorcoceras hygrometricum]|uniref:Uncharacterized protein n=1 Tax=Dorcoceras hygrometricum TaxID=472368 RepID=A0A2Z7BF79_9LAMI|nr:hypothetical protein F511_16721 [Dorcoceras hygrometricum]
MRDMMGETRPAVAIMVARLDAHWPRGWPLLRASCWASLCDMVAGRCATDWRIQRRAPRLSRPCVALRRAIFVVAAAARRCSGDVVTADFFYGLVRACPGQSVKLSGRYSISGPFWSILKF